MELTLAHLDSSDFPFQKMAYLEIARKLDEKLMPILMEELSIGNRITSADNEGPYDEELVVYLSDPFNKRYEAMKEVVYDEDADCHFNISRYATTGPVIHALIAPYQGQEAI
jgi:hypothetical protein